VTVGGAPAGAPGPVLPRDVVGAVAKLWWIPLITGIAWLLVSLIVLRFDTRSATAIGVLAGVVFIAAGLNDIAMSQVIPRLRWLYLLLGVALIVTGILALISPSDAFKVLAAIIGWFLLFKGTFDVVTALMARPAGLWLLTLIVGIIELLLAFWCAGFFNRSAFLLIIFVGASALARGITQLVVAFELRELRPRT
jgi:uncharacterized membrane protein HdeD (DUF308 family)